MMRKQLAVVAVATVLVCGLALNSRATLLFSEGFNYTAGTSLAGNDGWASGGSALSITNGNLTYPGLADLGGNELLDTSGSASSTSNQISPSAITDGTVYYSFILSPTALPTANEYLTSLTLNTLPSGSSDPLVVYVGAGNTGNYKIGVRHGGSGAVYTNSVGANVGNGLATLNSTNFIVVAYTFNPGANNDSVSLWFDPTPGGSMPAPDEIVVGNSGTVDAAGLQTVGFKAQSSTAAGNWIFDTLRIGDTWADVTPAVPEPSTWALVASGLALMFGMIRRRRS